MMLFERENKINKCNPVERAMHTQQVFYNGYSNIKGGFNPLQRKVINNKVIQCEPKEAEAVAESAKENKDEITTKTRGDLIKEGKSRLEFSEDSVKSKEFSSDIRVGNYYRKNEDSSIDVLLSFHGVMILEKTQEGNYIITHSYKAGTRNKVEHDKVINGKDSKQVLVESDKSQNIGRSINGEKIKNIMTTQLSSCALVILTSKENKHIAIMHLDARDEVIGKNDELAKIIEDRGMNWNYMFTSILNDGEEKQKITNIAKESGVSKIDIIERKYETKMLDTEQIREGGIKFNENGPSVYIIQGDENTDRAVEGRLRDLVWQDYARVSERYDTYLGVILESIGENLRKHMWFGGWGKENKEIALDYLKQYVSNKITEQPKNEPYIEILKNYIKNHIMHSIFESKLDPEKGVFN